MLLNGEIVPNLASFDAVFIGGGNTYKLLEYLKRVHLDSKLKDFIKNNGIVYGGSAGAIVLGSNISTVLEENKKNFNDHEGLNILNKMAVICHYQNSLDQQIIDTIKSLNTNIYAIPEDAGLILNSEGNIQEVINKVFVFSPDGKIRL